MTELTDIARIPSRISTGWGFVVIAAGVYAVGLLVSIRLVFSGWSMAMLGIVGDKAVDAADEALQERLNTSKEQQVS